MQYPITPGCHLAFPIGLLQVPKAWRNLEQTRRNLANKVQAARLGEQLNMMQVRSPAIERLRFK
jgi:hypothetical protein